jgi:hypothetical protein
MPSQRQPLSRWTLARCTCSAAVYSCQYRYDIQSKASAVIIFAKQKTLVLELELYTNLKEVTCKFEAYDMTHVRDVRGSL